MKKIYIDKEQRYNININLNTSIETEDMTDLDPIKFKTLKIINSLFFESNNIDLFSTNELERIILFTNFDKRKTLDLIENKSKEQIFKLIEEADKLKLFSVSTYNKPEEKEIKKKSKAFYQIGYRSLNLSLLNNENVWYFIHKTQNFIDLQDFLLTYDHHKLINKAKKNVKDKDCKKIMDYFEKFYKERERKYREIFKGNLEENDMIFLETEEHIKEYRLPAKFNLTGTIQEYYKFPKLFESLNNHLKSHIVNFLDLQSVGKFSMCNKSIYRFVSNTFNSEKLARFYCLLIFKNTNLYHNDEKEIKMYKNYFEMYKKRPRIFYSGIYYSKIKFIKIGETYGNSGDTINTVFNYRFYRFFPNGEVFSFTCPTFKPKKIVNLMQSNTSIMRKGNYMIDKDNHVIIEMSIGSTLYTYKYKIVKIDGPSYLHYNGIELIECKMTNWNDTFNLEINEKFPKLFKFRSFNLLKNDIIIIKKIIEE